MTMFTQRETRILDQARDIISRYYQRGVQLCSPDDVRRCVMVELAPLEHEEFGIILLDNQGVSLDIENYCTLSSFFNHFWFFWKRNILDVKTVMRGH
ncbi:hypothetical protein OGX74_19100 [Citrobacter sp. CK197]|nr:hypothetical protein [Citrobacter sp. CK197]MDM2983508.1 hypothetical protein [Citrobacter sp. CK197]